MCLNKTYYVTKADIVHAFGQYGYIEQVHIVQPYRGNLFANIAFLTFAAAEAAALDSRKIQILDRTVSVGMKPKWPVEKKWIDDRTVHVGNINAGTTEEQLKKLFESSGEKVERAKLIEPKYGGQPFALIIFKKKKSVPAALNLHNYFLNGTNLKVTYNHKKIFIRQCYEDLTVVLKNKQKLKGVEIAKLESIFSGCGEIQYIDVLAKKRTLAYITFAKQEAAEKALEMNGQVQQELELEMQAYSPIKDLTSIHIFNLDRKCTTEDIQRHFAKVGPIVNIVLRHNNAVVRFKDSAAYCKSFLYNETYINRRVIFIEPFCKSKGKIFEDANSRTKRRSRRPY